MPDIITFGCLALGCYHLSDATQLLDDMERANFRWVFPQNIVMIRDDVGVQNVEMIILYYVHVQKVKEDKMSTVRKLYDIDWFNFFSYSFRPNLEIMTILIRNGLVKGNYFFVLEILRGMNKRDIQPDEKLLAVLEESRARARSLILKQVSNKSKLQHYYDLQIYESTIFMVLQYH